MLAAIAVVLRLPSFFATRHLTFDDGVFGASVVAMRHGGMPFSDVFSSQGPLSLPLLWLGLVLSRVPVFAAPKPALLGAMAGYLSLWSVYWVFKQLTGKEGMGHGDFKLLAALGAWTGLAGVLPTILLSSLIGAVVGSIWLAAKGKDSATPIPFGPYLAIAGWISFFWGKDLVGWYMRLAGLA